VYMHKIFVLIYRGFNNAGFSGRVLCADGHPVDFTCLMRKHYGEPSPITANLTHVNAANRNHISDEHNARNLSGRDVLMAAVDTGDPCRLGNGGLA